MVQYNIDLKGKTILVTGAAGFIGSNLCKRLLKDVENVQIVGIDNMNDYYDVNIKKERFFVRANERGLGDSAEHIYANANKKAEFYIRPCKRSADIVLSGAADRIEYKNFLNKIIGIVQELYFS